MTTKQCRSCQQVFPLETGFYKENRNNKDGYQARCRKCHSDPSYKSRKKQPAYARKEYDREQKLRNRYKLSLEQYDAMLAAQGGGCAICGTQAEGRELSVDHDHACCPGSYTCGGCIRGLLCGTCNTALGKFRDSRELLFAAIRYLDKDTCCEGEPQPYSSSSSSSDPCQ